MDRIQENTKKTFELDEFLFHYINEDGLSVLCMTDKKFNFKQAFAFLVDVKKSLLDYYTSRDLERAGAHALTTFPETIQDKMVRQKTKKKKIMV